LFNSKDELSHSNHWELSKLVYFEKTSQAKTTQPKPCFCLAKLKQRMHLLTPSPHLKKNVSLRWKSIRLATQKNVELLKWPDSECGELIPDDFFGDEEFCSMIKSEVNFF
jgi:hypothetical protein